jgi:hypothetical protein
LENVILPQKTLKLLLFMQKILIILTLFYCSCQNPATEPTQPVAGINAPGQSAVDRQDGLLNFRSTTLKKGDEIIDLCKVGFETGAPLFPDAQDQFKRTFNIEKGGTYVVIVSAANTRTTYMLRQEGKQVKVLSSNQYPCLSNIANFHMNPAGDGFLYDGGRYTVFNFGVVPTGEGFTGVITWDKYKEYGIEVRKRSDG